MDEGACHRLRRSRHQAQVAEKGLGPEVFAASRRRAVSSVIAYSTTSGLPIWLRTSKAGSVEPSRVIRKLNR